LRDPFYCFVLKRQTPTDQKFETFVSNLEAVI
jgi:hypothetical protein